MLLSEVARFQNGLSRVRAVALALLSQVAASSPDLWDQHLQESDLPFTIINEFTQPPLQADSIKRFIFGLRNVEALDQFCETLLFTSPGPELTTFGSPGFEQGLT